MKIVFMGTPDFAVPSLRKIAESEHEVLAVVTQPDRQKNRGKKVVFSPVKEASLEYRIEVLQPERIKSDIQVIERLKGLGADIFVVEAYGQILSKEILEIPKFGSINVHGSILPKLRGASPIQHSILTGDKVTGITIMQMAEGLDTGDMISKCQVEIGDMTSSQLEPVLAEMGGDLLLDTLKSIEEGTAVFTPQDDNLSTYAPLIRKEDGLIDFSKSAESIYNQIRAYDPWPGTFAYLGEKVIKFWASEVAAMEKSFDAGKVVEVGKDYFLVACGTGLLKVTEVQAPGKRRMETRDFLLGNSLNIGDTFTMEV